MRHLALLLLIAGCAHAPLTEDEQFDREYAEADREIMYQLWEQSCLDQAGVVYSDGANIQRWKRIPRKRDWDYDSSKERPAVGNNIVCISEAEVREFIRNMF